MLEWRWQKHKHIAEWNKKTIQDKQNLIKIISEEKSKRIKRKVKNRVSQIKSSMESLTNSTDHYCGRECQGEKISKGFGSLSQC